MNAIVNTETIATLNADAAEFGGLYARAERGQSLRDEEMFIALKGLNFEATQAFRASFIDGAKTEGFVAPEKLWERTINRLVDAFDYIRPRSESGKAKQISEKRQAAKDGAKTLIEGESLKTPRAIREAAVEAPKSIRDELMRAADDLEKEQAKSTKAKSEETAKDVSKRIKNAPAPVVSAIDELSTWEADLLAWIVANRPKLEALAKKAK
jgi:enoyl-CoA hydratase/carnithine racemase